MRRIGDGNIDFFQSIHVENNRENRGKKVSANRRKHKTDIGKKKNSFYEIHGIQKDFRKILVF